MFTDAVKDGDAALSQHAGKQGHCACLTVQRSGCCQEDPLRAEALDFGSQCCTNGRTEVNPFLQKSLPHTTLNLEMCFE